MMIRRSALVFGAALALAAAPSAFAQGDPNLSHAPVLANTVLKAPAKLTVTSPVYKDGGDIPFEYTAFRANTFPGFAWSKGPAGTKSYVVVLQGVEKGGEDEKLGTSVQMLLYNVPPDVTKLDTGTKTAPAGVQGLNVHALRDFYVGPHTHSDNKHAYHLEVFALDRMVPPEPKMSLLALEPLMQGHVLAEGELVGWAGLDPDSPEAKQVAKGEPITTR